MIAERIEKFKAAAKLIEKFTAEAGPGARPKPKPGKTPLAGAGPGTGILMGGGSTAVVVVRVLQLSGPCGVPIYDGKFANGKLAGH